MQLPDWCFGRRWPIGVAAIIPAAAAVFDITEFALPDKMVVWEVIANFRYQSAAEVEFNLALGNHLPANDAEFNQLELLMPGIISPFGNRGAFETSYLFAYQSFKMRLAIESTARNLVGRFIRRVGNAEAATCNVIISSVPREVPDWLVLGRE